MTLSIVERLRVAIVVATVFVVGIQVGTNQAGCDSSVSVQPSVVAESFKIGRGSTSTTSKEEGSNSRSFGLTRHQSFGFFDDVDDESWKMMQERARTRKNHRFNDPLKAYYPAPWWYMNNFEPDFTCVQERRVGGPGDGPKWVSACSSTLSARK